MRRILALLTASVLAAPAQGAGPRVVLPTGRATTTSVPLLLPQASLIATPGAPLAFHQPLQGALTPLMPLPASAPRALDSVAAPPPVPAAHAAAVAAPAIATLPAPAAAPTQRAADALERGAALAAEAPSRVGRLYDAAPAGPDFESLSPVKAIPAPQAWTPRSALLKPFAGALNATRRALHDRRLANAPPARRLTLEEMGLRDTLAGAHQALLAGRPQEALEALTKHITGASAKSWFRANSPFDRYREKGLEYYRFAEDAVLRAYGRAYARADDRALAAEARAAALDGSLLGRPYRSTPIQDKNASHCAQHALFNAITASVGFAYPLTVRDFIKNARETLNVRPAYAGSGRGAVELESAVGVRFGIDVDEGMDDRTLARYASLLGLKLGVRGPPADEAGWRALVAGREQPLLTFRMVHPRYRLDETARAVEGHDYELLHHAVYLLGAFPSPSRGAWLFMVQDSGSGVTSFHTAEELSALTRDVQLLGASAPVRLPSKKAAE